MYACQVLWRQLSKESLAKAQSSTQWGAIQRPAIKRRMPHSHLLPTAYRIDILCVTSTCNNIVHIDWFLTLLKPEANEGLAKKALELYYTCCRKSICKGFVYSFCESGSNGKCPFWNLERMSKTNKEVLKFHEAGGGKWCWCDMMCTG
jgi:hypothetical protein